MNRIYLDNAATTPVDPAVFESMRPFFEERFGNPSSGHYLGQQALDAVENARRQVAGLFHADPKEIIFTGSGTEADNTALLGPAHALRDRGRHIIISSVEHSAVLESANYLSDSGWEISRAPVDARGVVDPEDLKKLIKDQTVLISVMTANNETGAVQPVDQIAAIAREKDILFHTDAVQGIGSLDLNCRKTPFDFVSISGHKIYGPKGVGVLFIREKSPFSPLIHGGGQEKGRRSSTHNVPGIVGLGTACRLLQEERKTNTKRIRELRNLIWREIQSRLDDVHLNSSLDSGLPNILHVTVKWVDGEAMLRYLDVEGVAASAGSACSHGNELYSHVLKAMGRSKQEANGSLRLSLGKFNTKEEIIEAAEILEKSVRYLRSLASI